MNHRSSCFIMVLIQEMATIMSACKFPYFIMFAVAVIIFISALNKLLKCLDSIIQCLFPHISSCMLNTIIYLPGVLEEGLEQTRITWQLQMLVQS